MDFHLARRRMVEHLVAHGVRDRDVLRAMGKVPRHLFVEEGFRGRAYGDHALPIGFGQTISQPHTVALMTEALALTGQERVLEIGTGSGYQTAVLAELCEQVFSVERVAALARRARGLLERLGYHRVAIQLGDGTRGWRERGPFDAALVAAGGPQVPESLLGQLADGGRLVIPVGDRRRQTLLRVTRDGGRWREEDLGGCAFVDLVGEEGWRAAEACGGGRP